MAAVGPAEAFVGFECRVDTGRIRLAIISQMDDVLVEPGQTRRSEEVLLLATPWQEAMDAITRWIAVTHGSRVHRGAWTGWCSWYNPISGKIAARDVLNVIDAVRAIGDRLKLDTIQIDDGFQKTAGDWDCNSRFPQGWAEVVRRTRELGSSPMNQDALCRKNSVSALRRTGMSMFSGRFSAFRMELRSTTTLRGGMSGSSLSKAGPDLSKPGSPPARCDATRTRTSRWPAGCFVLDRGGGQDSQGGSRDTRQQVRFHGFLQSELRKHVAHKPQRAQRQNSAVAAGVTVPGYVTPLPASRPLKLPHRVKKCDTLHIEREELTGNAKQT